MRKRSEKERGEGKLGCLVLLILMVSFAYICIQTVPVYLDKINFEEGLARMVSKAGVNNWPNTTITAHINALARVKDFEITPYDVTITRPERFQVNPEIRIEVNYRRPVEFPGYTYTFHFRSKVSSFVGRL
ncbi:MAG: hypothetical protein ACE5JX_07905 [Acidobacteriota bacterium]